MNKRTFIIILVLLIGIISINYTYSKLNITFKKDMVFVSKEYKTLTITNTSKKETNVYSITLNNENDYDISFACEDISNNFTVSCNNTKINANSNAIITVELDMKDGVDESTLTKNPSGDGYVTKMGIRITSPYKYDEDDPHYVLSDEMIVIELVVTNLKDYIDALPELISDHGNKRFVGLNPKNYVSFNGEEWRILGVFDNKVKIVRTTPYNNNPYEFYDGDASGSHSKFSEAQIKSTLNDTFYYSINQQYKSMIKESTWNIGGINTWEWQDAETAYTNEKSDSIKANVGLISVSDFVYATGQPTRSSCLTGSILDSGACKNNNWLYNYATTSGMWTLNRFSAQAGFVVIVGSDGNIANNSIAYGSSVYPVVSLDENAGFTGGDGTQGNPYRIKGNAQASANTTYKDVFTVYNDSWGNILVGFDNKTLNAFDKEGGALLFSNDTWGIPSGYSISQVYVYDISDTWANNPLAVYTKANWISDSDIYHERQENFVFNRNNESYLSSALATANGGLKFIVQVSAS